MKKTTLLFRFAFFGLVCCAAPLHAYANTFTPLDWNAITEVESDVFKLEQDIDQASRAQLDQTDLAQLSCLNGVSIPLIHIQGIVTREKELLQMATIMAVPADEQKIKKEQNLDISSDLDLLKGFKEQAKIAGKLCPDSPKTAEFATKIQDIDDQAASALRGIQQRAR